ncbi:MAG: FAD-dependent oxidoreductase [Elusimicrobia bacterium]|nr:FAD-dependent oxidoreductase [Elusimicrobiota bacterium]MDE2426093.1 FAD-dependent oxidoreductase [Elusimicrobiota bacterium]
MTEPKRRTPVAADVDVLVCGGGPAGYCAAIAAAEEGAGALLVERGSFLGGSATQALVLPLMTFHASPSEQIVRGVGQRLVEEVMRLGGGPGHVPDPLGCAATITPADPEALKQAVLGLTARSGARLLLQSSVVAPLLSGRRVCGAIVENKSGRQALRAKVVVDATGDADLAFRAKAPCVYGRESDALAQPMTLMFRMSGVDGAAVRAAIRENPDDFVLSPEARRDLDSLPILAVSGFFSLVRKAQAEGRLGDFRDRVLYFELPRAGEVIVNMTRVLRRSGVDAAQLTAASLEGYEQARQAEEFLRRDVPGFSRARLVELASQIGVRETRRIVGRATLGTDDVLEGRLPADGVARGAFPIDLHSPDGSGLTLKRMKPGASYSIPYGCLLPKNLEGLLVAGRAISASHEAAASARLSPTCMALGEAAGVAAALSCARKLPPSKLKVAELRRRLLERGAVV